MTKRKLFILAAFLVLQIAIQPLSVAKAEGGSPSSVGETQTQQEALVLDQKSMIVEKGRLATIQASLVQQNGDVLPLPSSDITWISQEFECVCCFSGKSKRCKNR